MRFVSGILSISSLSSVCLADTVCSEDIVRTATEQGFLRTIFNCLNYGEDGAQLCLGKFIADNAEDNEFPITGDCREAYQDLANAWEEVVVPSCGEADVAAGEFPSSYCVTSFLAEGMEAFFAAVGFYPMYPHCSVDAVRQYALENTFAILTSLNTGDEFTPSWTASSTSMCDFCYTEVFETAVDAQAGLDADWAELCHVDTEEDDLPDVCIETTVMENIRLDFARCAGSDIAFAGPVCDAAQVAAVEELTPRPFFLLANCIYHTTAWACTKIDEYFDKIDSVTGSEDCGLCYHELQTNMMDVQYLDDAYASCAEDVLSDDCVSIHQSALISFEECSGSTLDTSPTANPIELETTEAVAEVDTTTAEAEDTTTTESVTTTAEATTTTSKGTNIVTSSVTGIVLIAILSSMAI